MKRGPGAQNSFGSVNPRPVGGAFWPPLWFFLNSKKTAARSAAKFSVPSRASIWHLHTKFQVLGHLRSGVIEVKLRSCSSKNEQKSCNLETLTKSTVIKQFQSSLYGLVDKKRRYKTAISDFQNFWFLTKKKSKNWFFLKNFEKIQNFSEFRKNRNICDSPSALLYTYQISDRYLVFWPSYSEKTVQKWWRQIFELNF